jgi:hypothetical protein
MGLHHSPITARTPAAGIYFAHICRQGGTMNKEKGAIGYILMWLMGVPATLLFLIFLLRGCT